MFVFILWLIHWFFWFHWFGAGQFGYSYMLWLFGRYPREKTRKVDTCCFMVFKKVLTHFSIFLLLTPAYLVMATKLKPHGAMIMVMMMMMMRRRRPTPRHTPKRVKSPVAYKFVFSSFGFGQKLRLAKKRNQNLCQYAKYWYAVVRILRLCLFTLDQWWITVDKQIRLLVFVSSSALLEGGCCFIIVSISCRLFGLAYELFVALKTFLAFGLCCPSYVRAYNRIKSYTDGTFVICLAALALWQLKYDTMAKA